MVSHLYNEVLADLNEPDPIDPFILPDPYNSNKSIFWNARNLKKYMRWSTVSNDRIGGLINAYYLGYLFEERIHDQPRSSRISRKCRKQVPRHYVVAATRIYRLFKILGPQQLYRTKSISYPMFLDLKKNELSQLMQEAALIIVGTMN